MNYVLSLLVVIQLLKSSIVISNQSYENFSNPYDYDYSHKYDYNNSYNYDHNYDYNHQNIEHKGKEYNNGKIDFYFDYNDYYDNYYQFNYYDDYYDYFQHKTYNR